MGHDQGLVPASDPKKTASLNISFLPKDEKGISHCARFMRRSLHGEGEHLQLLGCSRLLLRRSLDVTACTWRGQSSVSRTTTRTYQGGCGAKQNTRGIDSMQAGRWAGRREGAWGSISRVNLFPDPIVVLVN